jgi:hypothetical protein
MSIAAILIDHRRANATVNMIADSAICSMRHRYAHAPRKGNN